MFKSVERTINKLNGLLADLETARKQELETVEWHQIRITEHREEAGAALASANKAQDVINKLKGVADATS